MNFKENPPLVLVSEEGPGTKSRGAGMHQGATEEPPRSHQGCLKEGLGTSNKGDKYLRTVNYLASRGQLRALLSILVSWKGKFTC